MRIVIDLQGAQTESRFRGIGRYCLSLAKEMARNRGEHEMFIALNGLFPKTIEPIRAEFEGLLSKENIRVWYAQGPVREIMAGNEWRRQVAEKIREAFLASLTPDVVHISSLFEGYVDGAITSIRSFDQNTPTFVTLYDLIPLLNPDQYLRPTPNYETFYLTKIEHLKRAHGWLCISESTAREGCKSLNLRKDAVVNISAACDERFRQIEVSRREEDEINARFKISKPFVLYTGGSDYRKNLHRLIRAYAQLPLELRKKHRLVLAGKMPEDDIQALRATAKAVGLDRRSIIFTGYISDEELVKLYNLCELFVFPSWHEGFGLPALEAMSCGAPVICANTSSLQEVACWEEALFDPYSHEAISAKIARGLTDHDFRKQCIRKGTEQAKTFSWKKSACRALAAFENFHTQRQNSRQLFMLFPYRRKLAYISPLPPERSGIADYSSELLPELARFYETEVIVSDEKHYDSLTKGMIPIRNVEWFIDNADRYERVLYHFGNSPFHKHMFGMLKQIPGVICLHDFFLSGYSRYIELNGNVAFYWSRNLYHSHGYKAVADRFNNLDSEEAMYEYPCNLDVLQSAVGIIVHSDYSRRLAKHWYGPSWGDDWIIVPFLRAPKEVPDRERSRYDLNLAKEEFVVCSFGMLAATKYNHRLLDAWLASDLSSSPQCRLIFVGENDGGEYGKKLHDVINQRGVSDRISITGWAPPEEYARYLAAADLAVQLRTLTRGETSAAVFDCMSNGLPTIVNANGALAEVPQDAVWMLNDEFDDKDLVVALETLRQDETKRKELGRRARERILEQHTPRGCALKYAEAIEDFYRSASTDRLHLVRAIAAQTDLAADDGAIKELAKCIAQSLPDKRPGQNLFIDVSATCRIDLKTGIERVTRAILQALITSPPEGYRVEPVYLNDEGRHWQYRFARHYTLQLLECPNDWLPDDPVEVQAGDVLLIADMSGWMVTKAAEVGLFDKLRQIGVSIYFIVFDLLPVIMPQFFPPGAEKDFESWLRATCSVADGAICISRTTADELRKWVRDNLHNRLSPLWVSWVHLGADIGSTAPSKACLGDEKGALAKLGKRPTFLMVGTIEPRKGHLQVISAFDALWRKGVDVNLVIVGKEGWKHLTDRMRRTIPTIVQVLRQHRELGKRLFWLEGISDEFLERVYTASTCLIAASEGEGFGLPLIEAAQHQLPIIARDIEVFREVAGNYAYYFSGKTPGDLADAITEWLELYKEDWHPKSGDMHRLTWKACASNLLKSILPNSAVETMNCHGS